MTSTIIDEVAAALQAKLAALTVQGQAVKAHKWAPRGFDQLPAAVIEAPKLTRGDLEAAESELSRTDWLLDFPITLYVELDNAETAQAAAVDFLEAFTLAIDADAGLSLAGVLEARLTAAEPVVIEDQTRALYAYETTVEVLRLHDSPY